MDVDPRPGSTIIDVEAWLDEVVLTFQRNPSKIFADCVVQLRHITAEHLRTR
jgi:hypothetical protein